MTVDVFTLDDGNWASHDALSVARMRLSSAVANGVLAFIGGFDTSGDVSDAVDLFDTETGTWNSTQMSQPRVYHASAGAGNLIVIAGGTCVFYYYYYYFDY